MTLVFIIAELACAALLASPYLPIPDVRIPVFLFMLFLPFALAEGAE